MSTTTKRAPAAAAVTITRVFDAPVERVWRAWTDPALFTRWWGPANFTAPAAKLDVREGGHYLHCMRGPDGRDYWSTGVYQNVVPMKCLVYSHAFADAAGNPVPAARYGLEGDWPMELLVTLTFSAEGGKTRFTLRQEGIPEAELAMCTQGWNESFDKLDAVFAG